MSFNTCQVCDTELEEPTIEEDLTESYVCHVCDTVQDQHHSNEHWMVELALRISELEEKAKSACKARQYSDQMICGRCHLVWDINDPNPPFCKEESEV